MHFALKDLERAATALNEDVNVLMARWTKMPAEEQKKVYASVLAIIDGSVSIDLERDTEIDGKKLVGACGTLVIAVQGDCVQVTWTMPSPTILHCCE